MSEQETALVPTKHYGIEYTPDQITLIKNTVARGASDDELQLFVHWCRSSGFDPLRKQAHFQINNAKCQNCKGSGCAQCNKGYVRVPVFIAGIDGLLSRANEFPDYGGITGYAVHEKDEFSFDALSGLPQKHIFGSGERGKLVGAWARVNFKDGKQPLVIWYPASEYASVSGFIAGKLPDVMIVKAAMSIAIRRAFPNQFSGVYSPEEFGGTINAKGELLMPNPESKAFLPKPDGVDPRSGAVKISDEHKQHSEAETFTEGVINYRKVLSGLEVDWNGKWLPAGDQIKPELAEKLYTLFENKFEADNHTKKHFKGNTTPKTLNYEEALALYEWKKNGKADTRWYADKIAQAESKPDQPLSESIEERLKVSGLSAPNGLVAKWAKQFKWPQPYSLNPDVMAMLTDIVGLVENGTFKIDVKEDVEQLTSMVAEASKKIGGK